jgi:hypothetical protein
MNDGCSFDLAMAQTNLNVITAVAVNLGAILVAMTADWESRLTDAVLDMADKLIGGVFAKAGTADGRPTSGSGGSRRACWRRGTPTRPPQQAGLNKIIVTAQVLSEAGWDSVET